MKFHHRIRDTLSKHENMWNVWLGHINVTKHAIDLNDKAKPFKSASYRSGPTARKLKAFKRQKKLESGVVEPATFESSTFVLSISIKDEQLRFCVVHCKFNEIKLKNSYPLPRTNDRLDSLGHAEIFSTLDAYSGYWQINICKNDRPKTSFFTHSNTYQYIRMPSGLTSAPASFQHALDIVLTKCKWKTCLVYLDYIIIVLNSIEEHIDHVNNILYSLQEASAALKIRTRRFFTNKDKYICHIVRPKKLG